MPGTTSKAARLAGWLPWLLLALLAGFGFLHLGADFPNHSRWTDDAAKFTDEGWYAAGALNHILTGHWLRPGDFNPMVTIPVWSVLLEGVFHFTGISLVLARGLAFLFMLAGVFAARSLFTRDHPQLAPVLMLLLLGSPLLYFFSRIAILEPALIFFLVAAAVAAYGATASPVRVVACAVLFVLAMLTKSSALFVAPAILYLWWFPRRSRPREALRAVALLAGVFLVLYGSYWFLVVRTHPVDVRVLYAQNAPYLGLRSVEKAVRIVYRSFTWVDPILFPLAVLGVLASLGPLRVLWRDPLFGFAVLLYVGYSGFMLAHFDAGPRYFAVLVLPVAIIVLLFWQELQRRSPTLGKGLAALIGVAVLLNVVTIGRYLMHPDYTLRDADLALEHKIDSDPAANRLVIGHGAMQSTFITLIPALDDIGDTPVAAKLAADHPGWLVTYSDDLAIFDQPGIPGHYTFIEEGRYPVLDNPNRQFLLLYRIFPR